MNPAPLSLEELVFLAENESHFPLSRMDIRDLLYSHGIAFDASLPEDFFWEILSKTKEFHPWALFVWSYPGDRKFLFGFPFPLRKESLSFLTDSEKEFFFSLPIAKQLPFGVPAGTADLKLDEEEPPTPKRSGVLKLSGNMLVIPFDPSETSFCE